MAYTYVFNTVGIGLTYQAIRELGSPESSVVAANIVSSLSIGVGMTETALNMSAAFVGQSAAYGAYLGSVDKEDSQIG